MKRLVLYGDSNTYGYDAGDFLGDRYPADVRWAGIVSSALKDYEVIEAGMNGRMLPSPGSRFVYALTRDLSEGDILVIMLGTNDILLTMHPDHTRAVSKMRALLSRFKETGAKYRIVVIGPVPSVIPGYREECIMMNRGFGSLCSEFGFDFVDAGKWGIDLAHDGCHFTESGHRVFAGRFIGYLKGITQDSTDAV